MWENKIDVNQVIEIRAKTIIYFDTGTINKIYDICDVFIAKGIKKVVIITGKGSHTKTEAWDVVENALVEKGIDYVLYSKISPAPTVDQVDEAARLALAFGAAAVVGIGCGSPIDSAKSVAILLANPGKNARDIYEFKFASDKAAPIVAIT